MRTGVQFCFYAEGGGTCIATLINSNAIFSRKRSARFFSLRARFFCAALFFVLGGDRVIASKQPKYEHYKFEYLRNMQYGCLYMREWGGRNLIQKKIKKSLTKGGKAGVMRGSLNLRGTA